MVSKLRGLAKTLGALNILAGFPPSVVSVVFTKICAHAEGIPIHIFTWSFTRVGFSDGE